MPVISVEEFRATCKQIVRCPKANNYAKSYAKAGMKMAEANADRLALEVQAIYILNNITGWRGENHKEARQLLKDFSAKVRG